MWPVKKAKMRSKKDKKGPKKKKKNQIQSQPSEEYSQEVVCI